MRFPGRRSIYRTLGWMVTAQIMLGGPAGFVSLRHLSEDADAVVVGSMQQVVQSGTTVTISLDVQRVLKGQIKPQERVTMRWQAATVTPQSAGSRNQTGLWFLKSGEFGVWTVLPVMNGDVNLDTIHLPLPAGPLHETFTTPPDAATGDKVAAEIAAAIETLGTKSPFAIFLLLGTIDVPVAKYAAELQASPADGAPSAGLSLAIRSGDAGAVAQLAGNQAAQAQPFMVGAVCAFRNTDRAAIASLATLLSPALAPPLQQCAAFALKMIHTADTVPYLAGLLDSRSPDIRYDAVSGLAAFANNFPIQDATNFANMSFLQSQGATAFTTPDTMKNFPGVTAFHQQESVYSRVLESLVDCQSLQNRGTRALANGGPHHAQ